MIFCHTPNVDKRRVLNLNCEQNFVLKNYTLAFSIEVYLKRNIYFICTVQILTRSKAFQNKMAAVNGFICDYPNCGIRFSRRWNLNRHKERYHSNEISEKCLLCQRGKRNFQICCFQRFFNISEI